MTLRFDQVVPSLIGLCEGDEAFKRSVRQALIVRDLRGRVRLVLEGGFGAGPDDLSELVRHLQGRLDDILGGWFAGPILITTDPAPARQRLARELLKQAQTTTERWAEKWPVGWPTDVRPLPSEPAVNLGIRWRAMQAVFSKESWVAPGQGRPPWPLRPGTPRITAFYSFKGGVGRTTLLAMLAWRLARAGRRVVCIDLDLEAPGLGALFLGRGVEDQDPSVLEWLLTNAATGARPSSPPTLAVQAHETALHFVPAGALGGTYLEKLARLDLLRRNPRQSASPVAEALRGLLAAIRHDINPDHIFIDCRAGLHDLGGLALNELAHVDVLIGRDGPQDMEGLAVVIEALGWRRQRQDRRLVMVQSLLATRLEPEVARIIHQRHRDALHALFSDHLYEEPDIPAAEDDQAAHYPWQVTHKDSLTSIRRLEDVPPSTFDATDYSDLLHRLEALWTSETVDAGADRA